MTERHVPGEHESPVAVGQELAPGVASNDVLPSTITERADGSPRFVAYSAVVDGDGVEDYWISIDLDAVVPRELHR